ncbi:polyphosphate--nucleotide phosphotransferase [Macrococcoides caseolyticum]|uniref:PPK2 family polyphosphate kinase n=1 Tax=Macrococcoides caseolyticum TaxID=69966 RepID=UPI000A2902DE|nr:PPK2 family polyphosphate kinase [Macrococcus caseolyticus]ARQ03404.1 Polyphosphate kinase 2 (PPK2) [Macrococcus caseolyticus]PKE05873.1 polyphosphate--nucleotide phosphotransferase [Macrococcus caseolyticus]PKE23047.1 polyphosphate--nucleotide phosphotransferase [Macrococcus caseolyticus]PKE52161.1 polyphosphate--nucleotide phosphotransferase [Macrococcus caseolyticus]PKF37666.1 polyphosphate--nucleotide phosphotransferase [Macrococcus caseolyticus]
MDINQYKVNHEESFSFDNFPSSENKKSLNDDIKGNIIPELAQQLRSLHLKLHAAEENGILVVLQALDAAGKDEVISYIFSNLSAQGLKTTSFGKPTDTERKHDYLWRFHDGLPERGQIGILNRSYYEDVLAPRIHNLVEEKEKPDDAKEKNLWHTRYRQINDYERYLTENGFHVIKFFFNMSHEEQRNRLLERMTNPDKNWEFSFNDVKEREYWEDYQKLFSEMLEETSTEYSSWYVLPADDEWHTRRIVTEVMIEKIKSLNPQFPTISQEDKEDLDKAIERLKNEQ